VVIRFYFFETVTIQVMLLLVLTPFMLLIEYAGLVYAKDKNGFLTKFVIAYCD
jgi:hypothetical protein